jgi:hypothetical protein
MEKNAAKIGNWFCTDIEKIVREAVVLCPPGGTADILPGECLHDVAQNTKAASSIGATQHTQVMRCDNGVADFPLMGEQRAPVWHAFLEASVDVVQVGSKEDAFFLSVVSREPHTAALLQFYQDVRYKLLLKFGGQEVDFHVGCYPRTDGDFAVVIAPVAVMERRDGGYVNPDTGEAAADYNLPCETVDASQGKGNMMVWGDEKWNLGLKGREVLVRLYDFNRKIGARQVVDRALPQLLEAARLRGKSTRAFTSRFARVQRREANST